MNHLKALNRARMRLYSLYRANAIGRQAYLKQLKPLDKAVEKLEMSIFNRKALSKKRA